MTGKEALEIVAAARAKGERAYLADANLAGADLADADLARANLAGANLAGAYLAGANLAGADLADANLADADLARAIGIDPASASTESPPEPWQRRTPAELMARFRARHPEVPVVEALDKRLREIVCPNPALLDMGRWHGSEADGTEHSCQTTHCRAGWAITLAGEAGRLLERAHGPARAGAMIYRASTGRVPHFYATNAAALEDIRRCAAEAASAGGGS